MKTKFSINSALKITLAVGCIAAFAQFGFSPKNANATSSALTGKCALIANHNMAGFENYCAAHAGSCDNSVNALVLLNFDSGTYQYAATAIANPWKVLASQQMPKEILDNASDYTIAVGLAMKDYE